MKLASYQLAGWPTWGVIQGDEAINVGQTLCTHYSDLKSMIAADAFAQVEAVMSSSETHSCRAINLACSYPEPG